MTQKPYFRDVWALGPSNNGYPGAFPRGFVNAVKRRWWGRKRCWLFSGSFKDEGHTTVDIKPELKPSVVANCEHLPFPDENFDFMLADPPYSEAEAMSLYGLPYYNIVKVLNEMARVCKPGGTVLFFHRLIPAIHPGLSPEFKQLKMIGVVGIFTIAGFSNMRALTVWKKQGKLDGVLYG